VAINFPKVVVVVATYNTFYFQKQWYSLIEIRRLRGSSTFEAVGIEID